MNGAELKKLDDNLLEKFCEKFPSEFAGLTARVTAEEAHKIMREALATGIKPDRSVWNFDPDPNILY